MDGGKRFDFTVKVGKGLRRMLGLEYILPKISFPCAF